MPIRSFVAVEIDDAIRAQLSDLVARLRATDAHVRWSRPENLHVTLKFLGDIAEENVGAARKIVEDVAARHSPFEIEVAGLGAFPNMRRPRVVFAHVVDATDTLTALARALEREMVAVGAKREKRPFRSHLTLGRVKSPRGLIGLAEAMAELGDEPLGRQTVQEIVLMRSDLKPSGAVYSRLGVGKLGP